VILPILCAVGIGILILGQLCGNFVVTDNKFFAKDFLKVLINVFRALQRPIHPIQIIGALDPGVPPRGPIGGLPKLSLGPAMHYPSTL
jgi:hypothetical protein